jgi:Aspartyl protease
MKTIKFSEAKLPRWSLLLFYILAVIGPVTPMVSESKAESGTTLEKAIVRSGGATLFSKMSTESKVVASLTKGEEVIIKFRVQGSEGVWCAVAGQQEAGVLGYVQCKQLGPEESRKESWQQVGSSVIKSGLETTKITVKHGAVLVPATLAYQGNKVNALLLLDTGSSRTVINTETAGRLNIDLSEAKKGRVQVVGGAVVEAQQVRLGSVTVGPHIKKNPEILVVAHKGVPVNYDGLLGMDFLSGLKYDLDFEKQVIRWE